MSGGKRTAMGPTSSGEAVPSDSKKMIQSIREIVGCSEAEIYSMLKECNMDPSEAVHRLLTQDTFHEVKSKREKKKEIKDVPESRSRAVNNSTNRGPRVGADRGGRISSTQMNPNDHGVPHDKPAHKKENGVQIVPPSSSIVSNTAGSNLNQSSPICEVVPTESTAWATSRTGGLSLPSQPSPGQHNWSRAPGQMSMADIVKKGRPQGKVSGPLTVASDVVPLSQDSVMTNVSQHKCSPAMISPSELDPEFHTSHGPVAQDEEIKHELGTRHDSSDDDWLLVDKMPAENGSDYQHSTSAASIYTDPLTSSTVLVPEVNLHLGSYMIDNQVTEGHVNGDGLPSESIRASSLSDRVLEVDKFGHNSHLEDNMLNGIISYRSQVHAFEHHKDALPVGDANEEMSSAAANLQQLNLHEDLGVPSAEDNPAVIIPSHLQVNDVDCSHLSFGSFGSGASATFSGSFPSKSPTGNLEVTPGAEDAPSSGRPHSRTAEYYDNNQLETSLNEDVASRNSPGERSYDIPSVCQPETVTLDAAQGIEGNFPSVSGYGYSATAQQTAAAYAYPEPNLQMQDISPFSSVMQPYANSLPSSSLTQTVQPLRGLDHPFSSLLTTHSMPLKYNTATSYISGPTISTPEMKYEVNSPPRPTQPVPATNVSAVGGSALPQNLPLHPNSQPTIPSGHFANMISYPFLPPSYALLPSAGFQQAYAGNGPFHQSPAARVKYTLPPFKSSTPSLTPGYGSFPLNPSTSTNTTPSLDEAMNSLYKEGSQYLPLLNNENSTLPAANTFYGFQEQQNQHNGGYRRAQQQPSPYGPMGYLNLYQSQGGPTRERRQQNPSDGNSQGPALHRIWQHGY